MGNILEIQGLYKSYGAKPGVVNLSMSVGSGKIVGLLGPNGCGKTTTMKIIAGLIKDYTGQILIDGHPVGEESKREVSFLPEKTYLSSWMRPDYIFSYFEDFYADFDKNKAYEMLQYMQINPHDTVKSMSKGTQEKLQLILVMCRAAKLYVLDEPLSGIDPAARSFLLDVILKNYSEGSSILLSTHLIYDIERILDDVIMMRDGYVFFADTVDSIRQNTGKSVDEYFREVYMYAWQAH